jgi:hypothetical protein
MDCCRFYTQYYISRYIYNCEEGCIPFIAITSEINDHNLPRYILSGHWLLEPFLPCYESPQKSSLHIVTVRNDDGLLLEQTILSQHDQK